MPGPAHKSGHQERKEKKKRELDPKNNIMINFFHSAQKASPSQAQEANDSQEPNIIASITSQKVASISEGATSVSVADFCWPWCV